MSGASTVRPPGSGQRPDVLPVVLIEQSTVTELAQNLPGWAQQSGFDADARLELLVVLGSDRARLVDIRRLAEAAIGGDPVTLLIRDWIDERCEVRDDAVALTDELYKNFARWAAEKAARQISIKGFAQRLHGLGFEHWRHPRNRLNGVRLLALRAGAPQAAS